MTAAADSAHDPGDADAARLVAAMARGDEEALGALYDRHGKTVWAVARGMLRDDQRADEVTQDVFLSAWRNAGRYDDRRAKVLTWLVSMARNRSIDRIRSEQVRSREIDPRPLDHVSAASSGDDPGDVAVRNSSGEAVRRAVAALPDKQREAITLAWFGGFSQSELAEQLGEPIGTVKTRMFYGMRRLRELLDAEAVEVRT